MSRFALLTGFDAYTDGRRRQSFAEKNSSAACHNAPDGEETDQRASQDRLSAAFKLTAPRQVAARRGAC
jgi:hypothetical protein